METLFNNLGFSYAMSKLLPFILLLIFGAIVGFYLIKKGKNIWIKIFGALFIIIPFTIYFAINPIWEGDLSSNPRIETKTEVLAELTGKKLIVISLPGCDYCKLSFETMRAMKKKDPSLQIEYSVTSKDENALKFYKEFIKDEFPTYLSKEPQAMINLAQGGFPTFVLVNNNEPLKVWSNNSFGVAAMDEVVKTIK